MIVALFRFVGAAEVCVKTRALFSSLWGILLHGHCMSRLFTVLRQDKTHVHATQELSFSAIRAQCEWSQSTLVHNYSDIRVGHLVGCEGVSYLDTLSLLPHHASASQTQIVAKNLHGSGVSSGEQICY